MSQRRDTTKWFCYILALSAGPLWNPVKSVTVKSPPSNPTTVQAQAKFFQYRHLPTSEDFDQGHRLGSDRHFTERHERSRPSAGLFSAKVRWGDKKGGYGEHYWDLNHAGNVGNHGNDGYDNSDDGSYSVRDHPSDSYSDRDHPSDSYDDPSDHSSYGNDEYDPEKSSGSYEENGRSKRRAYSKTKAEKKPQKVQYDDDDDDEDEDEEKEEEHDHRQHRKQTRKQSELETAPSHQTEEASDVEDANVEVYNKKIPKKHQQHRQQEVQQHRQQEVQQHRQQEVQQHRQQDVQQHRQQDVQQHRQQEVQQHRQQDAQQHRQQELQQPKEPKNQVVLVVKEKDDSSEQTHYNQNQQSDPAKYVNYENGAGVRQHQQPEVAASTPRLFLDHSTGRVVDRATGQAYILQPILSNNY